MLYVRVQPLQTLDDLQTALQNAIQLEFSTIPLYLTSLYTIKPGTNAEAAAILRSVVIEEMLHMCLACNILNAVGGQPHINAAGFPPAYPGPLPMGIGSQPNQPFIVSLQKLSMAQVQNVFMVIEEPDNPLHFPVKEAALAAAPQYRTIGDFYAAVSALIGELGPSIFTGNPADQVTGWFPSSELFPVTSVATAQQAIDIIVAQGEGTSTSPLDEEGVIAHYYRYAQIANGRMLVPDSSVPQGFSYSGAPVVLDETQIWPMVDNPGIVPLPSGSYVAQLADQFDASYGALLNALQATFSGSPGQLNVAIGLMYSLRAQAEELVAMPIDGMNANAGPRWLFSATSAAG